MPEGIPGTAAAYGESDPRAGLAWAVGLPGPEPRESALETLAWACSTTDRAVAVEALEALPVGVVRSRLAAHVVGEWTMVDPDAALAWAEARPDVIERGEGVTAWASALAESDPRRAATTVADRLQAGALQDRAVMAVLLRWIQNDRDAAEQWVARFPEVPLREVALAALRGGPPPDGPSGP